MSLSEFLLTFILIVSCLFKTMAKPLSDLWVDRNHLSQTSPLHLSLISSLSEFFFFLFLISCLPKRKKEQLPADVPDGRLVSISPPFSQLDTRGKLRHLHSALEQCHRLLERAIAKEEEELDGPEKGEYENRRKKLKDRLSYLLINTRELLKAAEGPTILTPGLVGSEVGVGVSRDVFKEKTLD